MASYVEYKRDLTVPTAEFDESRILDRFFHSGQSVVFRDVPLEVEPTFKRDLARQLRVALGVDIHPLQLIVCGSAHLGFSPVPSKLGTPFDPRKSDVDIAVVRLCCGPGLHLRPRYPCGALATSSGEYCRPPDIGLSSALNVAALSSRHIDFANAAHTPSSLARRRSR